MRFGVLGPLEVVASSGRPVSIPESKVRALLACLLVHGGSVVSADRLAEDLWGDRQPENPAGALQRKVWLLRRALDQAEPGRRELVVFRPPGYLLQADEGTLDAARFTALTVRARGTEDLRLRAGLLAEALGLWRGPALAEFRDEGFAPPAVARLEEERLVALEEHAEVRLELGEHGPLVGELTELVAEHPLRERLRAAHLRALYRSGRQGDALDSYHDLRTRLVEELGLDPSPELTALNQAILRHDPALAPPSPALPSSSQPPPAQPATSGPLAPAAPMSPPAPPGPTVAATDHPATGDLPTRSADAVRTNLPTPLTPLIGRADAVRELRDLLGERRLVTLVGPGGVGKTRLAIETAREQVDDVADGVWLVELAGPGTSTVASTPAEAVAGVLGIRDHTVLGVLPHTTAASAAERLADALRGRELLLVLDNCEHVIERVATLTAALLAAAPGLRVLATSREPLGLAGEALWDVPPLEAPADLDREAAAVPEALERYGAVELFVRRAADADPGFTLTSENARSVAALCRRLDGIPLALELAATRVRALGVDGLVARLDDRFRLLATGHRGSPPRQQTLRAMIDWSWDLLTEPERIVLRRLAVHADGCTLEAAEAVCSGEDVPETDVLDLLSRLVAQSLVVAMDGPRFRLLESVASYCLERLGEAGETEAVRRRHLAHHLDLAERVDAGLRGPDQRAWLRRLDGEAANLRAALDTAVRLGDVERALRLVNALGWSWVLRGRLREAERSLATALSVEGEAATGRLVARAWQAGMAGLLGGRPDPLPVTLDLLGGIDDDALRARATWFLAFARLGSGDVAATEDLVDRALAGFEATEDRWGLAAALSTRAVLAEVRGDLGTVAHDAERSLELFRELGDPWGRLQAIGVLGSLAEITGDYTAAAGWHREALAIAEQLELWSQASEALSGLGRLALLTGDHARAEELHQRAQRLAVEHSSKAAQNFAELGLALGARRQGRLDDAERYLTPWLAWCDEVGWSPGKALILAELGFVAEQRGDAVAALALHRDGLVAARAVDDPRAVALAVEGLAGAQSLHGRHALAARLLGAAGAARDRAGAPLPGPERGDVDRITARLRAALGDDVFETEVEHGRAWDPDDCSQAVTRATSSAP